MPPCPLCAHVQESGHECDVCGRTLSADPAGEEVAAMPLEGFESTQVALGDVDSVPTIADLEPTALAPSPRSEEREPPRPACPYCARLGAPGEAFCPSCGVKLPPSPPPTTPEGAPERRCRGCGARVAGEVCPVCGARCREG